MESQRFNETRKRGELQFCWVFHCRGSLIVRQWVSGKRLGVRCQAVGRAGTFPCCCHSGRQTAERQTRVDICWLRGDESSALRPKLLVLFCSWKAVRVRIARCCAGSFLASLWLSKAAYVRFWVLGEIKQTASKAKLVLINVLLNCGLHCRSISATCFCWAEAETTEEVLPYASRAGPQYNRHLIRFQAFHLHL